MALQPLPEPNIDTSKIIDDLSERMEQWDQRYHCGCDNMFKSFCESEDCQKVDKVEERNRKIDEILGTKS